MSQVGRVVDRQPEGSKGRRTEQTIKNAARVIFARDGYLNARITDIADEAGRSPATLYNYFDNKREILDALLQDFMDLALSRADSATDTLRGEVAAFWRGYTEFLPEMVGAWQGAAVDADLVGVWMQMREVGVANIAALVISRQQRGAMAESLDPHVAASALSSMLEHTCYLWLGLNAQGVGRPASEEQAIDTITLLWAGALGLSAEKAGL